MRKQFVALAAVLLMPIAVYAEEDWRAHGGSQTNKRFSLLKQINEQTVAGRLRS
jgi:glucose dehydrogenase